MANSLTILRVVRASLLLFVLAVSVALTLHRDSMAAGKNYLNG